MAAGTAPGWLEQQGHGEKTAQGVELLKNYLQAEQPPHDYSRLLLLWAAARMPGLISDEKRGELVAMVLRHQREDGAISLVVRCHGPLNGGVGVAAGDGWFRQGRICSCGSSGGWQCLAGLCLDTVPRAVAMACVPQRHKAPGCGRGLFSSCARPCTSRAGAAAAWPLRRAGPWHLTTRLIAPSPA